MKRRRVYGETRGERVVLFYDRVPLLLTDIRRNAAGDITKGYVVNGNWTLLRHGNFIHACVSYGQDDRLVHHRMNRIRVQQFREVAIPADVPARGYNNVIQWAERPAGVSYVEPKQ